MGHWNKDEIIKVWTKWSEKYCQKLSWYINEFGNGTSKNNNFDSVSWIATIFCFLLKVRQSRNDFFKPTFPPKKRTNKFYFTAMKPQVDLFSFVFWRILKTPKRHFEINWPLVDLKNLATRSGQRPPRWYV